MGYGTYKPDEYRAFAASTAGKTTDEIYSSRKIEASLNPAKITVRESRDSTNNPTSTPVIVALDVTGSMGILADNIARKGLGTLFEVLLERRPITDPHFMFMGVGDAAFDRSPLQVSQFETAVPPIVEQLTKIYLEHGGGNNCTESYDLPWFLHQQSAVFQGATCDR